MLIQSSTKLPTVEQNEHKLFFLYMQKMHFLWTHVSLVTMSLPQDGSYEAAHVADYINM